jgi:hypothetical protein
MCRWQIRALVDATLHRSTILLSYAEVNEERAGFDTLESGLSLMTQAESPLIGVSPPNPVSFIASCSSLKTLARCLDVQSSHKSTSVYGAGSHSRDALAACQFYGSWLQRSPRNASDRTRSCRRHHPLPERRYGDALTWTYRCAQ